MHSELRSNHFSDNFNTVTIMYSCRWWNFLAVKANATEEKMVTVARHIANSRIFVDGDRLLLAGRSF